jgi:hypothetical protein
MVLDASGLRVAEDRLHGIEDFLADKAIYRAHSK